MEKSKEKKYEKLKKIYKSVLEQELKKKQFELELDNINDNILRVFDTPILKKQFIEGESKDAKKSKEYVSKIKFFLNIDNPDSFTLLEKKIEELNKKEEPIYKKLAELSGQALISKKDIIKKNLRDNYDTEMFRKIINNNIILLVELGEDIIDKYSSITEDIQTEKKKILESKQNESEIETIAKRATQFNEGEIINEIVRVIKRQNEIETSKIFLREKKSILNVGLESDKKIASIYSKVLDRIKQNEESEKDDKMKLVLSNITLGRDPKQQADKVAIINAIEQKIKNGEITHKFLKDIRANDPFKKVYEQIKEKTQEEILKEMRAAANLDVVEEEEEAVDFDGGYVYNDLIYFHYCY